MSPSELNANSLMYSDSLVSDHLVFCADFAPQTAMCLGDFDENGSVTVSDLLFLIAAWGNQGGEADLDQNGVVAVADLLILIANWGPCE